jgi:hypothetical protein
MSEMSDFVNGLVDILESGSSRRWLLSATEQCCYRTFNFINKTKYSRAPVSTVSVSAIHRGPKK